MYMKKILLFIISFVSIMCTFLNVATYAYNQPINKLQVDGIKKWATSAKSDYIYAISDKSPNLYVINTGDLSITKEVYVGASPSDVYCYKDNIYVSLPNSKQIVVVDATALKESKRYNTISDPYCIAVEEGQLFYVEGDQHCDIYKLNLITGIDTGIGIHEYCPDLEIDPVNHILYIGESGSSGSNFYAVSTLDYSRVTQSNYKDGYGFGYPKRNVVIDGQDIFYAGRRFDVNDLDNIITKYPSTVVGCNSDYVVCSTYSFYYVNGYIADRETGEIVIDLFVTPTAVAFVDNSIIIYSYDTGELSKYNDINDLNYLSKIECYIRESILLAGDTQDIKTTAYFTNNKEEDVTDYTKFESSNPEVAVVDEWGNVTALNAGTTVITAKYVDKTSTVTITVPQNDLLVDKWAMGNDNKTIYSISSTKKEVFTVDGDTMSVGNRLKLDTAPSDIYYYDNLLYIALPYSKKIVVVDPKTMTEKKSYNTASDPYCIAVEEGQLFYTEEDQHCEIYKLNLNSGVDSSIGISEYCPDIEIDPVNHILYVGESHSSGSSFYAISTLDYSIITKSNYYDGYGFPYPDRNIVLDGQDIFYAGRRFNVNDLDNILTIYPRTVVGCNDDYVVCSAYGYNDVKGYIADRETGEIVIDLFETPTAVAFVNNSIVIYSYDTRKVSVYSSINELNRLSKITCSINNDILLSGKTESIRTKAYYTNNKSVDVTSYTKFESSNPDVASVDSRGNVTALNAGTAIITAKYTDKTSTVNITVPQNDLLVDKWVMSNDNKIIYSISTIKKELFTIDWDTMSVVNKLKLESSPSDIYYYNNLLYVALPYSNKITVINPETMTENKSYDTTSDPYCIAVEDGQLFYAEEDQFCDIYKLDLNSGIDTRILSEYQPDIEIDPIKHILYIGESGLSGSDLYAISTLDYSVITRSNYDDGYGFPYPNRNIALVNGSIYYANRKFVAQDLNQILMTYRGQFICTNDDCVVTEGVIYNKDGVILGNMSKGINLAVFNDSYSLLYYNYNDRKLYKLNSMEPALSSIKLEGSNILTISSDDSTKSIKYTVRFYDQYGKDAAAQDVKYTLMNKDSSVAEGVSYTQDGVITLDKNTPIGNYILKAELVSNPQVYNEMEIKIYEPILGNRGDASLDGIIDAEDASIVMQMALKSTFNPMGLDEESKLSVCDVDGDGAITAADAAMILQKSLNASYQFVIKS